MRKVNKLKLFNKWINTNILSGFKNIMVYNLIKKRRKLDANNLN